jgi:hypothetical protein
VGKVKVYFKIQNAVSLKLNDKEGKYVDHILIRLCRVTKLVEIQGGHVSCCTESTWNDPLLKSVHFIGGHLHLALCMHLMIYFCAEL